MRYGAAIQIDPREQDAEFERAKHLLLYRLVKESGDPIEQVASNTTFERRDDMAFNGLLVAYYQVPNRSQLVWPV